MNRSLQLEMVERIASALHGARQVFARFTPGKIDAAYKEGHDPVTEADILLDASLKEALLRTGEGWLSEESADDLSRLECGLVWIVDPLDGTREFVAGIPEFCTSIALVEKGLPVAGGICNPVTGEVFLGSVDTGLTYNGTPAHASIPNALNGATILASRSEIKRGEWQQFEDAPFKVRPMGSVAYKLALVSAGLADATFSLGPKHEWDVAGGIALIQSGGGRVELLDHSPIQFNRPDILLGGMIGCGPGLCAPLQEFLSSFVNKS
jgi:myo-inositol-1(or 4)-monophosphatase